MGPANTFSLTPRMVRKLTKRMFPRVKLTISSNMLPGVDIYIGRTGPEGLILICENDWADGCGRIKLTIKDGTGSGTITQYFRPDTLARDFELEARRRGGEP